MMYQSPTGDVFESGCELMDATSMHRPDTGWRVVDANGHEHRWYINGNPANTYNPSAMYETSTLKWVFDEWGYYEDGTSYEIGHHECKECGDHVIPAFTSDTTTQYIPGLRWYRINGESVSREEFERRALTAFPKL